MRSRVERKGAMTSPNGDRVLRSSPPTCPVAPVRRMGPVVVFVGIIRCVLSALYGISHGDNAIVSGGFGNANFRFADDTLGTIRQVVGV